MQNIAVVTNDGNISFPANALTQFGISEGAKFKYEYKDGNILLYNSSIKALEKLQEAFAGEAEKVGWKDDDDVIAYCKEIRRKKWAEYCENND